MRIGNRHIILFIAILISFVAKAQVRQNPGEMTVISVNPGSIRTFKPVGDETTSAYNWYINGIKVDDSTLTHTDTVRTNYTLMVVPISRELVPVSNARILGDTFAIIVNANVPDYVDWTDRNPDPLCLITDTSKDSTSIGVKLKNINLTSGENYKIIYTINDLKTNAFLRSDTVDSISTTDTSFMIYSKDLGKGRYTFNIQHFYYYGVNSKKKSYTKSHIDLSTKSGDNNNNKTKIELRLYISIKPKIQDIDY